MGASLPLLSRALVKSLPQASRVIGALYGINTVGAGTGGLTDRLSFLPHHGSEGYYLSRRGHQCVYWRMCFTVEQNVPAHDPGEATYKGHISGSRNGRRCKAEVPCVALYCSHGRLFIISPRNNLVAGFFLLP